MTETEAKAWIQATERSRFEWRLDEVHHTADDAIIYRGGKMGYYINIRRLMKDLKRRIPANRWGVEIGTYQGAYPHIGEAAFLPLGRQGFTSPVAAVAFINEHVTPLRMEPNGYLVQPDSTIIPREQEDPDPSDPRFRRDDCEFYPPGHPLSGEEV